MLSRRNFLQSTVSLLVLAKMDSAAASIHGSPSLSGNAPVIVNYNGDYTGAFLNIAKWIQPFSSQSGWPGLMSGTGEYPNGTFTSSATAGGVKLDPTYYGHYLMSWSGTGTISTQAANPVIVYNGGAAVTGLSGSNTGEIGGNFQITGANANVEFAFGLLIGAVSISGAGDAGGAGLVKFTTATAGHAGNFFSGTFNFKFNNLTGLPAGPNSDGSWTINYIDSSHFSLQGSSAYAGLVVITSSGGPGTQTEGIYSCSSAHGDLSGTYSSFANLIWCRKNDLADINAGKLVPPEIVSAFAGTKAAYIRFMDMCQVQNIQLPSYAQRVLPTDFSWSTNVSKYAYWGGMMTNASDTFTVPTNPSASPSSGAYVDGEIVIAQVPTGGHNTTANPKMGITGRASAAPIYAAAAQSMGLINMTLTGTVPIAGTVLSFTFNGGGLNNFSPTYTVQSADGPGGTSFGTLSNNIAAALNANSTFTAAGWSCQSNNQPVPSFGSWIQASRGFYYNPNLNASGAFQLNAGAVITGTDPTSALMLTFGLVPFGGTTSFMADGLFCAFTYSVILGGWICTPCNTSGGVPTSILGGGPPLEYFAELCARANAGMWLNIGIFDTATSIYNKVLLLAQAMYNGQHAVKSLVVEWGNETWNFTEALWNPVQTIGNALGLPAIGYDAHGLRTLQMAKQAVQAWSDAGRARSDLKITNAYKFVDPNGQSAAPTSATLREKFEGVNLKLSNTTLQTIGGLGASSINIDMSVSPNRPIDWCDWISPATYWQGGQMGANSHGFNYSSTLSDFNGLLVAAYNYAYGTSAEQQAALDFLSNAAATSGDLYNTSMPNSTDGQHIAPWAVGSGFTFQANYYGISALLSTIDATRPVPSAGNGFAQAIIGAACYEGGWQMGPTSATQMSTTSGTNLVTMGYTNGYSSGLAGATTNSQPSGGLPGGDTATVAAANIYNLLVAWKNDQRAYNLVTQQFNQFKAAVNYTATRDAYPAWYGFTGPTNIWSLYPGLVTQGAPFQAYNAIAAWH